LGSPSQQVLFARIREAGRLALFCLFGAISHGVIAGSFEVNPIRVDLSPTVRSVALSVRNGGADAMVVQVSVSAWSQEDGKDILTPTNEVLVSPPIATIAPDGEQIIRVGLRRAPDAKRELSYRIFLQEVPPPPKPGFQGLVVALRVGLPIFVQPRQGPAKATLVWNAELRTGNTIHLKLENQGTGHIQISTVELFLPSEKEAIAEQSGLAYVLPGQAREWGLKLRHTGVKKGDRLSMKVSTDAGSIDSEIDLAGP
jgi:fimbrial chaperone protein